VYVLFSSFRLILEVSQASDLQHSSQRTHSRFRSRKETRKQERTLRKQKKSQHFLHPRNTSSNVNLKRNASGGEHDDLPKRKKIKVDDDGISRKKATSSKQPLKGKTTADSKGRLSAHTPPEVRSKVGNDEDACIAYLESKLGLKKTRRTSEDDGLDGMFLAYFYTIIYSAVRNRFAEPGGLNCCTLTGINSVLVSFILLNTFSRMLLLRTRMTSKSPPMTHQIQTAIILFPQLDGKVSTMKLVAAKKALRKMK
jgi:hypothetical protein